MVTTRFIHTADWQLGLGRVFLAGEAQHRYAQDRLDAVAAIGRLASEADAAFVVVAGDVFEDHRVDARTVRRALDVLGDFAVPVLLLPGNHDPLDAASVYRTPVFTQHRPDHVVVLDGSAAAVAPGVQVCGVPWPSKRPGTDLVAATLARLGPADGHLRVLVAHGAYEGVVYDGGAPATIARQPLERALAEGRVHYAALGDRHSATLLGERIAYSGTPEVTRFTEERPGRALVVELSERRCRVEERRVGRWSFASESRELCGDDDVRLLGKWLDEIEDKPRTVVRLGLRGQLSLRDHVALDEVLDTARDRFAAVVSWEAQTDLSVLPDEADRVMPDLQGYPRRAAQRLLQVAEGDGEKAPAARDALILLHRLARSGA
ncbi:MAG: metallophosphoesterase family protein [Egibacteraceae bacterium]